MLIDFEFLMIQKGRLGPNRFKRPSGFSYMSTIKWRAGTLGHRLWPGGGPEQVFERAVYFYTRSKRQKHIIHT